MNANASESAERGSDAEPAERYTDAVPTERYADTVPADRIVVSYPADLSSWGRFQVEKPSFRAFLRKTRETAASGDVWEEFVGVGCCGNTLDVPLRVERVEGGDRIERGDDRIERGDDDRIEGDAQVERVDDRVRIGPETEIDYEAREACGIRGSWRVQSAGGPSDGGTGRATPE